MVIEFCSYILLAISILVGGNWGDQQFYNLGESFLVGKVYFVSEPRGWSDVISYGGKYFWHLPPLPGLLMVPGVFVSGILGWNGFVQAYIHIPMVMAIGFMVYRLSRINGNAKDKSWLMVLIVYGASVFNQLLLNSSSWTYSQVVAVFLLLCALSLYYVKNKNWLLMGIFLGLLYLTRPSASIGAIFFLMMIGRENKKNLITFLLPIFVGVIIQWGYNYSRFGSFTENGYKLTNSFLTEERNFEILERGLFSIENVPTNLYFYFLKTVDPVLDGRDSMVFGEKSHFLNPPYFRAGHPGVGFFVLMPIAVLLFARSKHSLLSYQEKASWVVIVISMIVLLLYYWYGARQVGARYVNDFLPFIVLILTERFRHIRMSNAIKLVCVFSTGLNIYLFLTVFGRV